MGNKCFVVNYVVAAVGTLSWNIVILMLWRHRYNTLIVAVVVSNLILVSPVVDLIVIFVLCIIIWKIKIK